MVIDLLTNMSTLPEGTLGSSLASQTALSSILVIADGGLFFRIDLWVFLFFFFSFFLFYPSAVHTITYILRVRIDT